MIHLPPELPHFAAPRTAKSSDEWYTPDAFVRSLGDFDMDPCTNLKRGTQTARKFFTVEDDGLSQSWSGRVWLNPPFSNIKPWVERMKSHNNGIMLCFSRTDALWFCDLVKFCGALFLISRRLQFRRPGVRTNQRCPLGVVLFPFGEQNVAAIERSGIAGVLLRPTVGLEQKAAKEAKEFGT